MDRHFTATAFIVDSRGRTLLLWHKRLKRWMPPGGHVDPQETPEETAARECKEETNLDVEIVGESQEDVFSDDVSEGRMLKKPIALLLEKIPACPERHEPEHEHMDFLFLARPVDEGQVVTLQESESAAMQWFSRQEVAALSGDQIFANVRAYILRILP